MHTDDQAAGDGQSESVRHVSDFGAHSLTLDVVQDHPALWDWRLIVVFVIIGVVSLYLF